LIRFLWAFCRVLTKSQLLALKVNRPRPIYMPPVAGLLSPLRHGFGCRSLHVVAGSCTSPVSGLHRRTRKMEWIRASLRQLVVRASESCPGAGECFCLIAGLRCLVLGIPSPSRGLLPGWIPANGGAVRGRCMPHPERLRPYRSPLRFLSLVGESNSAKLPRLLYPWERISSFVSPNSAPEDQVASSPRSRFFLDAP